MDFGQTLTDFVDALTAAKAAVPAVESFLTQTEGAAVEGFENAETTEIKKYQTLLSDPRVVQVMITLKALEAEVLSGLKPGGAVVPRPPSADVETDSKGLHEAGLTKVHKPAGVVDEETREEGEDDEDDEDDESAYFEYGGDGAVNSRDDEMLGQTHYENSVSDEIANDDEAESKVAKANKKLK